MDDKLFKELIANLKKAIKVAKQQRRRIMRGKTGL